MAGIYLDSSILLTLPTNLESALLQNLHELLKKLPLNLYTVRLCVDECIQKRQEELPDLSKAATKLSTKLRMVMRKAPAIPDFGGIASDIEAQFLEGLKNNYIDIIETATPDVHQLLAQSVHHVRPFEPEDKGFKDAIIFKSILRHAKAQGVQSFYLLARDAVFNHPDLVQEGAKEGLAFKVWVSIEEAIKELTETLQLLDKMELFRRQARLRDFLLTQGTLIRAYVLREGEINPWPFGFSRIIGTKNVEFEGIERNPVPGSLKDSESAGRIPVQFIAQFEAIAVGEPVPVPPVTQGARLTEEIPQAELQEQLLEQMSVGYNYPFLMTENVEQEIHPRFVIQGTVHYDSSADAYRDLQFESVKQASEVVRRLLAKAKTEESNAKDSDNTPLDE